VYNVQKGFSFQTGDPIGPGQPGSDGGTSIWGLLEGPAHKTFAPEFHPKLKHTERGTVSMATAPAPGNATTADGEELRVATSQFIVTLGASLDFLDGQAAVFGRVVEGLDALDRVDGAFVDAAGRPLKDIRVRHTLVLDDPFPDPPSLVEPASSPAPTAAQLATVRIADDEDLGAEEQDPEALERVRREREARAQALTLEMVGDLPFAEVKPPENVLFVCKLNPVTADDDLELIFSRFGTVLSCEVIRDRKTGDSLQYAFIEFENQKDCEQAYFKMQDVLIDDHRIHVDFSQSVSKLSTHWRDGENARRRTTRRPGDGWGGVKELEKRRQYRAEETERKPDGRYGLVFDRSKGGDEAKREGGPSPTREAKRERSRSPPRQKHRPRERSRSPRRDRRDKERERMRSWSREHGGRRERDGPRHKDDGGHRSRR
jgi:peptidyl-prolyl cis-trans isomerase-like 4